MKIACIACGKKKKSYSCKAQEMYDGTLFKKSLTLAEKQGYDKIYILSAKYGLLELDQIISPYNFSLFDMSNDEIKKWSKEVKTKLPEADIDYYAGKTYYKFLPKGNVIWEGKGIGLIIQNLDKKIKQNNNNLNEFDI